MGQPAKPKPSWDGIVGVWNRRSVELGLNERRTGIIWVDDYQTRGRPRRETTLPNLVTDIHSLVDEQAQTDPKFQSPFLYPRISARVEFAKTTGLSIRLIYYPPYHSKYNPIERCWGVLENYWKGAILDLVETAVQWVANMTWKGIKPIVHRVETVYEKAIKVSPKELEQYTPFWKRSEYLPKWDITIVPA